MAGDAAAARDLSADLVSVCERIFGPEHPSTLTARANLAYYTGEAGDPATTRDQIAALLPVYERVLGPEHPDTLGVRASLASWTERAERGPAGRKVAPACSPMPCSQVSLASSST